MIKFNLDIPKMGYFLVYKNDGKFIPNQIEKEQLKEGFSEEDSKFIHVEVSAGGPYSIKVAPPRTRPISIIEEWNGHWIKIMRIKDQSGVYGKDYWRKLAKIAFWSATKCNLWYDWRGVLRFVLPFIGQSKKLNFCSENVSYALRKEFSKIFEGLEDYEIMPAHFVGDKFELVWEGNITKVC